MGYRGEQGNGLYGMCTSVVGFSTTERRWGANEKKNQTIVKVLLKSLEFRETPNISSNHKDLLVLDQKKKNVLQL